jgi:hypothetical protein
MNRTATPPFYPNAVTLAAAHALDAQVAHIHDLIAAGIPGAWAVKDSFCTLDLTPLGFHLLFEAMWIYRPDTLAWPTQRKTHMRWGAVDTAAELHAWELAWRGDPVVPAQPLLFLPTLLADPNVLVVAAYEEHRIVAGAIANRTGAVVGLSNVFVPAQDAAQFWIGCVGMVLDCFPDMSIVGYEAGEALGHAESLGFEAVHPLRVWEITT